MNDKPMQQFASRKKDRKSIQQLTRVAATPLDQDDRTGLSQLGSPVLGSQAADSRVRLAVTAAHRAGGSAHARATKATGIVRDRVAPQPVTTGGEAAARVPADSTFSGRANHAAAARIFHLPVVAGWRLGTPRHVTDLRAALSFPQQARMNRRGEEEEVSHEVHPNPEPPHSRSTCSRNSVRLLVPMLTLRQSSCGCFHRLQDWLTSRNQMFQ